MKDTNTRTFVKTVSYRFAVMVSSVIVAMAFLKGADWIIKYLIASWTIGLVSFLIHEKIWNFVNAWKDSAGDMKLRSIAKTISWRVYSFIVVFFVATAIGVESAAEALSYTIVSNLVMMLVHYAHERLWNLNPWGRK
jgi:uncharacterized membrane protein